MSNTIILKKEQTGYTVTYEGDNAKAMFDLFGTATIPTAFTPQADMWKVIREIKKLNPGANVEFGGGLRLEELGQ